MKIAIIGTRGVPPRYGGFETFAGELGTRLVTRGHRVSVYCRANLYPDATPEWNGIRRIDLPAINHKYLETVSHALLSSIDALGRGFDVALVCNAANAFVLPLLKASRLPVAINVDGIERKRTKWNALGRAVYMAGEAMSVEFADAVIADAAVIADYYRERHAIEPVTIAYGAELPEESDNAALDRLGLTAGGYILYVSRFEPENNPHRVVEAYGEVVTGVPLVMVGDAPYSSRLIESLKRDADSRVKFPGALYGSEYRALQRGALVYIQATEVGGTHPAMIEAMGSGGAVLALDTPENREAGGESVLFFEFDREPSLASRLREVLAGTLGLDALRVSARSRARSRYSWDAVTDAYETLLESLTRGGAYP